MQEFSILVGIVATLFVGVISPGPSFVMVARTAISTSRANALAAAIGMALGAVFFAFAALLGLQAVLLSVPSLYLLLKVVGGIYLAYLGFRIWGAAKQPLEVSRELVNSHASLKKSLALGFVTQVSNPKTAIVYASVFAAFLPTAPSMGFGMALVAAVFVIEASWYAVVASALSSEHPRRVYLRCKAGVDRIAAGAMMLLGLKLVVSAHRV